MSEEQTIFKTIDFVVSNPTILTLRMWRQLSCFASRAGAVGSLIKIIYKGKVAKTGKLEFFEMFQILYKQKCLLLSSIVAEGAYTSRNHCPFYCVRRPEGIEILPPPPFQTHFTFHTLFII